MSHLNVEHHAILTPDTISLVTGATGFIGGEITCALSDLIRSGRGRVCALVRPRPGESAVTRLIQRLSRGNAPSPAAAHVKALSGDMVKPNWGLSLSDLQWVTEKVDMIIHNAADTSFVARRSTAETNVAGTRELISLARKCQRNPLIVFMSTAANSGEVKNRILTEADGCRPENIHFNDYTYSKAIAEQMLCDSGLPVLILRPTIVLPAGRDDAELAKQILWFAPITRWFKALPIHPASRLDVIDVDFVIKATLGLLRKRHRRWQTYNLSAGPQQAVTTKQAFTIIDRYNERSKPLLLVDPDRWSTWHNAVFVRSKLQRRLFSALERYLPFLNQNVVYDDRRLWQELGTQTPCLRPLLGDLPNLLALIPDRVALRESARP